MVWLGEKDLTDLRWKRDSKRFFQRKAWILEGIEENQIILWGKETGGEGFERVEKKEETEKRPEAESDQEQQSELKGERWKF